MQLKLKRTLATAVVAFVLSAVGIFALAGPAQAYDYGPFKMVNIATGLCLEVPHGSMTMNEQLTISICGPTPTWYQEFYYTDACCAWHYFVRPGHNLWCITPGVAVAGSTIVQWGCDWGDGKEVWHLTGTGDVRQLVHANSGGFLTVYDSQVGGLVVLGGPSERSDWRLIHL